MLQQIINSIPKHKWIKLCKKHSIDLWDIVDVAGESIFVSESIKVLPASRYCRLCGTKFSIRSAAEEFYLQKTCSCGNDGKKKATVQKLEVFFPKEEAEQYIIQSNLSRRKGLQNTKECWVARGYSEEDAVSQVNRIQKERSNRSPASKKGVRGHSIRTKEYWVARGYSEEDAIQQVSKSQVTNGIDWYVRKYGDAGKEKFNKRIEQWLNAPGNKNMIRGRSAKSVQMFEELISAGVNGNIEKSVRGAKRVHRVDFVLGKKIIEYNGDYWHANPKIYSSDMMVRKKMARDIWEHDTAKIEDLMCAGFQVLTIWEHDYINSPDVVIKQCKDFLNAI